MCQLLDSHERGTMPQDQFDTQNPRTEYDQPKTEGGQIPHPGLTDDMEDKPDHGEDSYVGTGRLEGRRAIITGGDSGIGRAVAIAFAREGADVVLSYLPEEQRDADETARLVTAAGQTAVLVPGDITDEAQCQAVIDAAVEKLGGVDILVNNAAYQMVQQGAISDVTTEQFDRVMKTNLYAMFWLTKKALPHLSDGSTIINTSSIQAFQPSPDLFDYALTKAAIVNFTKSMSSSLIEQGIRVNCVAPGPIWTPLIPATMPEERVAKHGESAPVGRAGQPAEVAPAFVFFASQESSYVTGEVLGVTGGMPTK
jgi:NAD(P)-dependent dehydrogenase (short-subunit alcohol dehydrogenase family)